MSNPPKYQQIPQTELESRRPSEDDLPKYPPSGSTRLNIPPLPPADRSNVIYTFVPRYPILGEPQDALGVLGRDRDETTQIVQRGFPLLADYPTGRIEFLAPVELESNGVVVNDRWAVVMDEAWIRFKDDPPTRLKVQISDLPGDAEEREKYLNDKETEKNKKEFLQFLAVVGVISAIAAVICFIIWLCGGFETTPKVSKSS